ISFEVARSKPPALWLRERDAMISRLPSRGYAQFEHESCPMVFGLRVRFPLGLVPIGTKPRGNQITDDMTLCQRHLVRSGHDHPRLSLPRPRSDAQLPRPA